MAKFESESGLVCAPGWGIKPKGIVIDVFMGTYMWSALPLFIVFDIFAYFFQEIFFTVYDVPKRKRSDYIVMDRHKLKDLNIFQKFACVYCGYANGVLAWIKDIVMSIELFSCSIKHEAGNPRFGQDEKERDVYYKYEEFK